MTLTSYQVLHYIHVLGAFGLLAAMAIEFPVLAKLRTSHTAERAQEWLGLYSAVRWCGGLSLFALLVPGVWMAVTVWPKAGWVQVAFGSVIALGAIGGVMTGSKLSKLEKALASSDGPLPHALKVRTRLPSYTISWWLRLFIVLAVVALMVVKPDLSASVAIALGGASIGGLLGWIISRQANAETDDALRSDAL